MVGTICKRDILAHPIATVRCFGWMVFFRALTAGPRQTFLSILIDLNALHSRAFVEQCVSLELRAMRIYELLAQRFHDKEPVRTFFKNLNQSHVFGTRTFGAVSNLVLHSLTFLKFLERRAFH